MVYLPTEYYLATRMKYRQLYAIIYIDLTNMLLRERYQLKTGTYCFTPCTWPGNSKNTLEVTIAITLVGLAVTQRDMLGASQVLGISWFGWWSCRCILFVQIHPARHLWGLPFSVCILPFNKNLIKYYLTCKVCSNITLENSSLSKGLQPVKYTSWWQIRMTIRDKWFCLEHDTMRTGDLRDREHFGNTHWTVNQTRLTETNQHTE